MPWMRFSLLPLLLALSFACFDKSEEDDDDDDDDPSPRDACEEYVAALNACNGEYADSVDGAAMVEIDPALCEDAEEGASEFQCMAEAYDRGDCSTAEGFVAIADELAACVE